MLKPVVGQQVPFYNHNVVNPYIFNPAMAGNDGEVNTYLVRNQRYSAFGRTSINNYLSIDGSFLKHKPGFGFQAGYMTYGIQQQFTSSLAYSYGIKIDDYNSIRFGISVGVMDNRLDLSAIQVLQQDDPFILALQPNATTFDMNAGISYSWKGIRVGFAVPQLVGNKVAYSNQNNRGYYQLARHMMLSAEYDYPLSKRGEIMLKPNALLRFVPGAPLQYDIGAQIDYDKIGWASLTYKSDYSIQANVGLRVQRQFKLGYSVEYLIGPMSKYSSGMHHEIMLGFTFKSSKTREIEVVRVVEKIKEVEKEVVREVEKIVVDTVLVEKETVDTLIVADEVVLKENEELSRKNKELEELLRKALEENDRLEKKNDEIADQIDKQNDQRKEQLPPEKDSIPEVKIPDPPLEKIPYSKGYKFYEMNSSESPDGFYVVGGVFSSKKNAEVSLNKYKREFSDSYLVMNQKNGFYYVIVKYTIDQEEATKISRKYERSTRNDAWILNYVGE
jgi:type IX secretion system PorP/SprF family membrane protein